MGGIALESAIERVFGEPAELMPVIQQHGTLRWDIATRAGSAHAGRASTVSASVVTSINPEVHGPGRHAQLRHNTCIDRGVSMPTKKTLTSACFSEGCDVL